MNFEPFIVTGTGRSGTSTVARILHENMGINMGAEFKPPSPHNPDGAFEDVDFSVPNAQFINGKLDYSKWHEYMKWKIAERMEKKKPWGIKDPALSHILGLYFNYFEEPKVIRCVRDRELVVESMRKCYGWTKKWSEKLHDSRMLELDRALKNRDHLTIDFADQKVDDDTIEVILNRKFGKKPKAYVAILNHGWLRREMMWSRMDVMKNTPGVDVHWENPNWTWGEPICSNRMDIVLRFLRTDCDFLMMIDDDVVPLGNPMEFVHADKDIIGFPAKVRQRGRAMNWVAYYELEGIGYLPCDFGRLDDKLADLAPVDIVGTGCILIKRKVLQKLKHKKPFLVEFDKWGVNKYGTDFAFCRRAKKAGFEIYTAPNCICEHVKEIGLLDAQQFDDSDYRDESVVKYKLPFGEWSISQKDWRFMKEIIEEKAEGNGDLKILEFGSGLSSLLMSEYGRVVSYEMNEKHRKNVMSRKKRGNRLEIRKWDGKKIRGKLRKYDIAFVDGPTGRGSGGIGRRDSMRIAAKNADAVIVHDARREDEWRWQMTFLAPNFKLTKTTGHYQVCCNYWERVEEKEI